MEIPTHYQNNNAVGDEEWIKGEYQRIFGKEIDLIHPLSFNEKIQFYKLHYRKPLPTTLSDKFKVRDFVKTTIGEDYLIPLIGCYKTLDEIPLAQLPNKFIIKATHGSGWNLICKDKESFDWKLSRAIVEEWLNTNFYWRFREWAYRDIPPRIVVENLLQDKNGDIPTDYKFFCFNGEPKLIQVDFDRYANHTQSFFDVNWKKLPFKQAYPKNPSKVDPPENFQQMIEVARKLSIDIPFVRVDLYSLESKIYFGEMTFYPWAGFLGFDPPNWDQTIGGWMDITSIQEESTMNICMAADELYAQHCRVTITSILINATKTDELSFHILDGGISDEERQKIINLQKIRPFVIEFIRMHNEDFAGYPITPNTHFNVTNYYRLTIPKLFPLLKKALYLDSDTIVKTSLKDLYETNLEGYYLAAAPEQNSIQAKERMGMTGDHPYINSGVMLINCSMWRENEIEKRLFQYIRTSPKEKTLNMDQDAINGVLHKSVLILDQRWNAETRTDLTPSDGYKKVLLNPFIIHYVSWDKPWNPNTKQNPEEYQKYLAISGTVIREDERGFLNTSPKDIIVKRFGFGMRCFPDSIPYYQSNVYEEMTALFVRQMSKGIKTFIDVGANVGFFSILVGLSNPEVKIFSIEPVPEIYTLLKKNLLQNSVAAKTFQKAVSDKKGNAEFQISTKPGQSGFLANPDNGVSSTIQVSCVKLDDVIPDLPKGPVLIKVDTEGSEIQIINGMKRFFEKIEDIRLVIEVNPTCLYANHSDPSSLLNLLDSLGFNVYVIGEEEMRYEKYIPGSAWDEYMGARTYRNVYCIKKDRSLNLCFFSHDPYREGADRSMLEIVESLVSKYGTICTVLLPFEGPLRGMLEDRGVATKVVDYKWWCTFDNPPPTMESTKALMQESLVNVNKAIKSLEKISPDLILTNTMVIPWGAFTALRLNRPHIWFVREFGQLDHQLEFYYSFKQVVSVIEEASNHIIVNSEAVRKALFKKVSSKKCTVATNKIVLSPSMKSTKTYFHVPDSTKLVISGRVQTSKGQDDAIHAVIKLIQSDFNVELCVVGAVEHILGQVLRALVKTEGMEDRIHFLGFQEDVRPVLEQADINLTCSRNEAWGRVTAEAMLLGKPVIGTNTGGTVEMIEDGINGFLYSPGDVEQLAQKIVYFMDQPDKIREFGERARKKIVSMMEKQPVEDLVYQLCQEYKGKTNMNSAQLTQLVLGWQQGMQEKYEEQFHQQEHKVLDLINLVGEKEQAIHGLNSVVVEKDKEVKELHSNAERMHQELDSLISISTEKEKAVKSELKRINSEHQNELDRAKKKYLSELETARTEKLALKEKLDSTEQRVVIVSKELWEIQSSRTWRMLRMLLRLAPAGSIQQRAGHSILQALVDIKSDGIRSIFKRSGNNKPIPPTIKPGIVHAAVEAEHPNPIYLPDKIFQPVTTTLVESPPPIHLDDPLNLFEKVRSFLKYRDFIISISHDDYLTVNFGGIQMFMHDEQEQCHERMVSYIHLYPVSRIDFLKETDSYFAIGLNVDSNHLGQYSVDDIIILLKRLIEEKYSYRSVNLHQFKGWTFNGLNSVLSAAVPANLFYYIHDYFSICPQYNLLRNKLEYCNAPPLNSNACTICSFGVKREHQFPLVKQIFKDFRFSVIAPSTSAQSLWQRVFPDISCNILVEPHTILKQSTVPIPGKTNRILRIAYAGLGIREKGWDAWRQLVDQNTLGNFEAYHLGLWAGEHRESYVNVRVTAQNRTAMVEELRKNRIDVLFHWPIWPETFSYVLYEAVAAGCFILTRQQSGNVADYVNEHKNGVVFKDFKALQSYLSDPATIREDILEFRKRNPTTFSLESSSTIADLIKPTPMSQS